jgi:hypothetical protein
MMHPSRAEATGLSDSFGHGCKSAANYRVVLGALRRIMEDLPLLSVRYGMANWAVNAYK